MSHGKKLVVALTATLSALAGLAAYGASQVISPPRCTHRDDPKSWGLPAEEVEFQALDGTRLGAWFVPSPTSGAAIVVAHGFGGNRHTSLAHASFLYPEFSLLLPDLRGHGESGGRFTSVGHYERLDLIAGARYLRARGYGPIGVLGISMGAATAILAASASQHLDAVVADSSFAALRNAVRESARLRGYPGFISSPLAYLSCRTAALRLRYQMHEGDPLRAVARIAPRPLLIIHGEADNLTLVADAHALYRAAGEPKELWVLPGVEHARALESHPRCYQDRVTSFFRRSLGASLGAESA